MKNFHFLILVLFPCLLQGQEDLSVSYQFEKDTIYAFDPIEIKIDLINLSEKPLRVYPISALHGRVNRVGMVDLQFKYENDSIWQSSRQIVNRMDDVGNYAYRPDFYIVLNSKQVMSETYFLPPILFLESDTFINFKTSYFIMGNGSTINSKSKRVYIKEYNGIDSEAYQNIKLLPRPNFFYYPLYSVCIDKIDIEYAEEIIRRFPSSVFTPYCKLFLTNFYFSIAYELSNSKKDSNKPVEYLRKSKLYGYELINNNNPKIKSKSEELLGKMAGILNLLYDYEPPNDLLNEFIYIPKK